MTTKQTLIEYLSDFTGDRELAAERLGIKVKALGNWPTDRQGHVTSQRVLNDILATLMRVYLERLVSGKLKMHDPSPFTKEQLMELAGVDASRD